MSATSQIIVKLPTKALKALREQANRERRPLSTVVRFALEKYFAAHGMQVDFQLQRGGWRGGRKALREAQAQQNQDQG